LILFFYIVIPVIISLLITVIYKNYFAKLDLPDNRSSHIRATATSGGLGFVITSIIFSLIDIKINVHNTNLFFIACFPLALIGFIDDRVNLSNKFRYLIQFLVVVIVLHICINQTNTFWIQYLNINHFFSLILFILLILFGTGFINLINFMDGLDGLLACCSSITFLYLGFTEHQIYLVVFASIIPFIYFNWTPAKIFMGDIGSTFIGGLIISSIFASDTFSDLINLLLINSPLILDSSTCLIRRKIKNHNIFKPHKLHLYQRLNQNGWKHSSVTIIYLISTLVMAFSVIIGINSIKVFSLLALVIVGIFLENNFAISFNNSFENQNSIFNSK